MKIKRFNEATEELDISSEIGEMIESLKDQLSDTENKNKLIDSLLIELEKYKINSQKGNDQIDDSIAALQVIKSNFTEASDKLDTIISNLMNYNDGGRKYLYEPIKPTVKTNN
jgi:septal ring factor EnvC (AmiA/AmiB activator)